MSITKILQILEENAEMSVNDMADAMGVSRQMVHRALNQLQEKGLVEKLGKPPKTYYRLSGKALSKIPGIENFSQESLQFLQEHFMHITETGKRLEGIEAMKFWCGRQKLPLQKTIEEFIQTRKKYLAYFNPTGLIDGMEKMKSTKAFTTIFVDELYYFDFYAIERFGKTRLGMLLHFAKQGQNKNLMQEIVESIHLRLSDLIRHLKIDAVGYIPPTIQRNIQFMKVLQQKLNLPLPHVLIRKVNGEIMVPQKALSKIEDRISNAQASLIIGEKRSFGRVLLIDDAVGSGATLNQTAGKLKNKKVASYVIGIAITGSFKGFDVIQEV